MDWFNLTILTGIILCAGCGFLTTLNLALRDVSFGRLSKLLAARRREQWIETYRQHLDDFIRTTSTLRLLTILAIVLIIADVFDTNRSISPVLYHLEVFALSAAVVLLCGFAIPQPCATYVGDHLLAVSLPFLRVLNFVTAPTIGVALRLFDSLIRRLAGVPGSNGRREPEDIEQEVLDAVSEAELHGAVDKKEKAMIKSVMELDESTAGEIMTPRTEVIGIRSNADLQDIKELIRQEGHSRIPVYDENIDHVIGMIYAKDLLQLNGSEPFDLVEHMREVPFVPETKRVSELLAEFRTGKTHVAIVLDEYGGTAGLVTIEDILEELVGEITDEYEQPEPEPIHHISKDVLEVDSRVHVDEINELLELHIPESEDYETVGGFVFSTLGKIPQAGEQLVRDNARITILEAEDRRIKRLRIEVLHEPTES